MGFLANHFDKKGRKMTVLKTVLLILLIVIGLGAALVKYALNAGMRVPTNQELINGTKAAIEAKRKMVGTMIEGNPSPNTASRATVKATDIKRLKS